MLVNGAHSDLISIRDRGLLYGDGVFRTLVAVNGQAQHWPLHYQKLQQDCTALGFACPAFPLLSAELEQLLSNHPEGVLKLIVTRGLARRGYAPVSDVPVTHLWDVVSLPVYPVTWLSRGVKVRICDLRLSEQPRLAGIKHLNRLENVLAASEWHDSEIAEGLLLDAAEQVIEGTRSNVFMLLQGVLVTPDLSRCGVAGVQRARILAWAAQQQIAVAVRSVSLAELQQATEVMLCNSVFGVWSVCEIGQYRWHDFTLANRLRAELFGSGA